MENSVLVQMDQRLQDLVQKSLSLLAGKWLIIALRTHILLEVVLEVLEHKVKLILGVDHFLQPKQGWAQNFTYSTILGCLMPFRREISRIAVDGTPSSSFSSLIFFRATNSPVWTSRHL